MSDQRADVPGVSRDPGQAVDAPPLLPKTSTGPRPSSPAKACRSAAENDGTWRWCPSVRVLRPSPRWSYVTTNRSVKWDASVPNPSAVIGWPIRKRGGCPVGVSGRRTS